MKRTFKLFLFFSFITLLSCNYNSEKDIISSKEKIIFDSDMGPDYDDVGAIAILHAMANNGECEILATVSSNSHPSVAPTIEALNRYYGKNNLAVGIPDNIGVNFTANNNWNDSLLSKFSPDLRYKTDYPTASEVYRKTLSQQPDKSVTIVTIGFTTNLSNLLKTEGDKYSTLSGAELVRKKVKKWVAMAGRFPEGLEFNVITDSISSSYVFENWPTQILLSGFEIGEHILTGEKLAMNGSQDNPSSWAYKYNLATFAGNPAKKRMSWDQTAVLCAIRDPEKYFYVCGPGKIIVNPSGYGYWDANINKGHYFLVHKFPYQDIADTIDDLMMYEPK